MTYTENAMLHEQYQPENNEPTKKVSTIKKDICSSYAPVETSSLLSLMSNSYVFSYSCDNCAKAKICPNRKQSS